MNMKTMTFNLNPPIKWVSKNNHIIIAERPSFWSNDKNIFIIYRERRDFSKFKSINFYKLDWPMERFEDTLEEAIEFAKKLPDEMIKIY